MDHHISGQLAALFTHPCPSKNLRVMQIGFRLAEGLPQPTVALHLNEQDDDNRHQWENDESSPFQDGHVDVNRGIDPESSEQFKLLPSVQYAGDLPFRCGKRRI